MTHSAEWLETDGRGGYAMGRADGVRTRRYHALLAVSRMPPADRFTLVNGLDAWVETAVGRFALSAQRYGNGVTDPDGVSRLVNFSTDPWPTWRFRLPSGVEVVQELVMRHDAPLVALAWRLSEPIAANLIVRPFLSVRDPHATTHANDAFDWRAGVDRARIDWRPYAGLPGVTAITNGTFTAEPHWYYGFEYDEERARGLDFREDLASPGTIRFTLGEAPAVLALCSDTDGADTIPTGDPVALWHDVTASERERRAAFRTPLHRAADAYVVHRGSGRTIIAGYPWFADWGRDTFIALRGLCLASGRRDDARAILREWAGQVSEGMLPNRFADSGGAAEYNSVDAALWYVIAVDAFLQASERDGGVDAEDAAVLSTAVAAIVAGYSRGTRFGIRVDDDGLVAAGVPGVQLTWMDAKVGDWVVTPRIGKPVEIQALWINALRIAARWDVSLHATADKAAASFEARFWNEAAGCLFDVVDADGVSGAVDASVRPNQLLAVGGLPWAVLTGARARRVVDVAESRLWTPAGLRSLAADDAAYVGVYKGDMRERDGAYHQGTVWPWLVGAFVDAWVRVQGGTETARRDAGGRFLDPLLAHYQQSAPGHVGEIADGAAPHTPQGCPFQAWSVGEALWVQEVVLRTDAEQQPEVVVTTPAVRAARARKPR